jgi:hypothetical protein
VRTPLDEWIGTLFDQSNSAIRATAAWFSEAAERFTSMVDRVDPERRQALYQALGVRLVVTPGSDEVEVTLRFDREGQLVSEGGQVL